MMEKLESSLNQAEIDKTFKILSRPDIHELERIYREWFASYTGGDFNTLWNIELVRKYKWDWVEYLVERKKHGYGYPI